MASRKYSTFLKYSTPSEKLIVFLIFRAGVIFILLMSLLPTTYNVNSNDSQILSVFGLWKKPVFSDVLFYTALRLYAYIFVHLPSFTIPISETQCDYWLHPYSRVGSLKDAFFQIAT